MKRTSLFLFASFSLLIPLFGESAAEKKWRTDLGSNNFEERVRSNNEIWAKGEEAIPFLEKLVAGKDPELALRATSILRKVRLGITPETPEKIARLIDGYFRANPKGRVSIIESLIAAREYGFVLKLRKLEENEEVIFRIDDEIAKAMPRIAMQYIQDDDIETAKKYLLLSEQFEHLIQYASLLEYTGELDEEIARLRIETPGVNEARYLACLRVKGDPVLIHSEALRLKDHRLADLAAIVMGDHIPHFESLLEVGDLKLTDQHYLNWSLAESKGDFQSARELEESVIHLSKSLSEKSSGRSTLFKMGLGEQVIENLDESEFVSAIGFALNTEEYAKAQELIGIPEDENVIAWIDQTIEQASEELANSEGIAQLNLLTIATRFLEGRGEIDKATHCAFSLFDLGRKSEDLDLSGIASDISRAPTSTISAMAREIDEFGAGLADFAGISLFPRFDSDKVIWLDSLLQELDEKMTTRDRLLLTFSFFHRRLFISEETFTKARDKVLGRIKEGDDQIAELQNLFILMSSRNRKEDLLIITRALREAGTPNLHWESIIAADLGNEKEAAQRILEITNSQEAPPDSSAFRLYRQGYLMAKGGLKEGKVALENAHRFSDGSADVLRFFSDQHLRFGEIREAHELMKKALLRTSGGFGGSFRSKRRSDIVASLATSAAQLGEWQEALSFRELMLANYDAETIHDGFFALRYRLQLLVARGAVAMEEGDLVRAVRSFTEAHRILPGDGYLANELFPVVRELGLTELHDQLFAISAEFCRKNIRDYPKDDNVYNNFAWQAARANRSLNEAEAYLKIALEMNPHSAAYLDTMAEIEFARKNRTAAIEWSEKSLANQAIGNSADRWELLEQNRRFKTGGFPVR